MILKCVALLFESCIVSVSCLYYFGTFSGSYSRRFLDAGSFFYDSGVVSDETQARLRGVVIVKEKVPDPGLLSVKVHGVAATILRK